MLAGMVEHLPHHRRDIAGQLVRVNEYEAFGLKDRGDATLAGVTFVTLTPAI
jgi:hypothetical protein